MVQKALEIIREQIDALENRRSVMIRRCRMRIRGCLRALRNSLAKSHFRMVLNNRQGCSLGFGTTEMSCPWPGAIFGEVITTI